MFLLFEGVFEMDFIKITRIDFSEFWQFANEACFHREFSSSNNSNAYVLIAHARCGHRAGTNGTKVDRKHLLVRAWTRLSQQVRMIEWQEIDSSYFDEIHFEHPFE